MFKGKWRRQTKVPRTFREQDLRCLLDFVIDNSHFEINGYLFRQERGVAMGSPVAPPLCNLAATVEDFFWHQTMCSLRFRMSDFGVIWHERYVDNRFILLRDSAPSTTVLMNFLSLEFYRPPVMLETQHDTKVLGYMCGSSSRTITPQLPDHPSQIKGIRSANDQMFTYSSWSSRSWLIVRGAQPAAQQQIGLDALKRLYEAKGFDPHFFRDVRRRIAAKSVRFLAAVVLVEFSLRLLAGVLLSGFFMCLHFAVGSDVLAFCIAALLHLSMAEYVVSSLLRPDGMVQSTSQVTLDQLPNFINGNEMQLFVQTHGLVHLRNVQAHSSSRDVRALSPSRNARAMHDHVTTRRSRSPVSRRSRVGPHGISEDEEDWGDWTRAGRRTHDDQRRPRSPSIPPACHRAPSDQVELLHLPVRHPVPSLGSHRFALRSGTRIEEIAIVINEVLYYTLPCIATLAFPEPDQWKKSWETVYRSLMPHRRSKIDDEQRVKSVSELPPSPPPHGNPGPWTARVIQEISREFNISPGSLLAQLIVQLGVCEECWPYILKTRRTYHRFQPFKKDTRKNHFGIIFSFEPRRLLPDKRRTQSISPFFWAHNTNIHAAINILQDEELVRPSKWLMQPPPNHDYTNWNDVWLPPMGFYCRGSLVSHDAAVKAAAQFAGVHSDRPICIGGAARLRQPHCTIPRGGTYADIAASHYYDCIHAKDGRWKLRSSIAVPNYLGMFW